MNVKYIYIVVLFLFLTIDTSSQTVEFKLLNQFTNKHEIIPFTNFAIEFPDTTYKIVEVENGAFTFQSVNHSARFEILPNESSVYEMIDMFDRKEDSDYELNTFYTIIQENIISSGSQTGLFLSLVNKIPSDDDIISEEKIYSMVVVIGDSLQSFSVALQLQEHEYLEYGNLVIRALESIVYVPDFSNRKMDDFPFNFTECGKSMDFLRYDFGQLVFAPSANLNISSDKNVFLSVSPTVKKMEIDTSVLSGFVTSQMNFFNIGVESFKHVEFNGYYGYQGYGKSKGEKLGFFFIYAKENQIISGFGSAKNYDTEVIDLFSKFIYSAESN